VVSGAACPVCSEQTQGHTHYGGRACDSCKAFFRRTVVRPSQKAKRCRMNTGDCSLRSYKRNNCPYCRFQKCLKNGLQPELVRRKPTFKEEPPEEAEVKLEMEMEEEVVVIPAIAEQQNVTTEEKLSQILLYHRLILSQTAGVNLLTVPASFLPRLQSRLAREKQRNQTSPDIQELARLELAFLVAKENLHFFTQRETFAWLAGSSNPSILFTAFQEFALQIVLVFLKSCQFFQTLPLDCQRRLLRKNVLDVISLFLMMGFEKKFQLFSLSLGSKDIEALRSTNTKPFEIGKGEIQQRMSIEISEDLFEFANSMSPLEIPGHVLIVLMLISLYSREGLHMRKETKVDTARSHYQQLLYRYIRETVPEDQSSRLNASLLRGLKRVKDFAEKIRSYEFSPALAWL